MNSTQVFEAILNGDVDVTYFQAWLHDKFQGSYVDGYEDGLTEVADARNKFERECSVLWSL